MNTSTIYNREMFKVKFKDIYNDPSNKYDFEINNSMLNNIISKWKNTSLKFNKGSVLINQYDYKKRLIFREFRSIYVHVPNKKKPVLLEYIIWCNDENIERIRISKNFFIDCTFHTPPEFTQLMILMYKDILTSLNIPAIYILLNGKYEIFYKHVLESLINLITQNREYELVVETIVTDSEKALINAVKKYFPNVRRIACFFHYKQNIIKNIRNYGLYKKEHKINSDYIIKKLSYLPITYNGDYKICQNTLKNLKAKFPEYDNFLTNYFEKNFEIFFLDKSLDYQSIPSNCRTNNFLENYNGYIKSQLGKNRYINWVNFIHFIKTESERNLNKLHENANTNKLILKNKNDNNKLKEPVPKTIIKDDNNVSNDNDDNNNYNDINDNNKKEEIKEIIYNAKDNIGTLKVNNNNIGKEKIEKIIYHKLGIQNIGNTCYANSLLQILLHCKIFIENYYDFINKKNLDINTMSYKFYEICQKIRNIGVYVNYINISEFMYYLGFKHKQYSGYNQHDTQEFCRLLLEDFSRELNRVRDIEIYKEIKYSKPESKINCEFEFTEYFKRRENSIIYDLYYSTIISKFTCLCQHETYSFQNIMDIPLLLPKDIKVIDLEGLLSEYFKSEILEFETICEKCKKILNHKKDLNIVRPPKILILSLQRINYQLKVKNECLVKIPEMLDIKEFIDFDFGYGNNSVYELYSIINHVGKIDFGHYYSYIKLYDDNLWYEFDDSNVNLIGKELTDFDKAYILFYINKISI